MTSESAGFKMNSFFRVMTNLLDWSFCSWAPAYRRAHAT